MKFLVPLLLLPSALLMANTLVYSNNAWYSGLDPYLVGNRESFLIQGVTLDAVQDSSGFTGEFHAILKYNYGGPSPAPGNLSTISPFDVNAYGVVSTLQAADLFFKQSGVLRYGVPLVNHGGAPVNGNSTGTGQFDSGDLYQIANGISTMTSNQFLTAGTDPAHFGSGRTVWLTSSQANPQAVVTGTTQIYFNGECTAASCSQAEFTVTLNLLGTPLAGSLWLEFLTGVSNGTITPYFTGATCGNDLFDAEGNLLPPNAIPEPATTALLAAGLAAIVFRAKRRN